METCNINIVVIDTGVKADHKLLKEYTSEGVYINNKEELILSRDFSDSYGHGTAVNYLIKQHIDKATFFNIRIYENDEYIEERQLLKALTYVYENVDCNLINVSLGLCICENYSALYGICEKLKNKGVIIVAAYDNSGAMSYPACLDNVIGVTSSANCKNKEEYFFVENSSVNVCAYGNMQKVPWIKPEIMVIGGNSFACPHITGIIANAMCKEKLNFENVLSFLQKNAKKVVKEDSIENLQVDNTKLAFPIKKAALFPFNKEMHSLVKYYKLLNFEIRDVYDIKYSFHIGATTKQIMKDNSVQELFIKNYEEIEWNEIDTLILGHTDELGLLINHNDIKKTLIEQCVRHGKNIYSFDDLTDYQELYKGKLNSLNLFYPKITNKNIRKRNLGKLYKYSKPIVGIFGTSSKQGKFTLQLGLRENLLKQDYLIGEIGTEPSSLLYGMDCVYPMGYNNSVYLKEEEVIYYLNNEINQLCLKNYDLILVGGQSGILPYDNGNIALFPIHQMEFILATQPDVIVLCVNPFDEISYIKRCIQFLESIVTSRVLTICMYPMNIKDDWKGIYGGRYRISDEEFYSLKEKIESVVGIPVLNLDHKDTIEKISNNIVDYFSEV